jgi:CobQ-like glutamine amidotransferase family enzyme
MLTVALLYPELFGTYGDGGNALVLVQRALRRGVDAQLIPVGIHEEVPDASIYLVGGGEDGPQRLGTDLLRASSFPSRVRSGGYVLAVCAGLQILGTSFAVEGDDEFAGLGLIDATTRRGTTRSVGELVVRADHGVLVGFENHGGLTTLGDGIRPLGAVERGRGNDGVADGFKTPTIWASYAHGPLLAMNPWFADEILATVLGRELDELDSVADQLYVERRATLAR